MDEVSLLEIQLLDANGEYVSAEWSFSSADRELIRIGRAQDNDVIVADRYVSRYHAELSHTDGAWAVRCMGRHGMSLDGSSLDEAREIPEGVQTIQFGGSGLTLRVTVSRAQAADAADRTDLTTMLFAESPALFPIHIDEDDKARTVDEITGGEFFQALQAVRQRMENQPSECQGD